MKMFFFFFSKSAIHQLAISLWCLLAYVIIQSVTGASKGEVIHIAPVVLFKLEFPLKLLQIFYLF